MLLLTPLGRRPHRRDLLVGVILGDGLGGSSEHLHDVLEVGGVSLDEGCGVRTHGLRSRDHGPRGYGGRRRGNFQGYSTVVGDGGGGEGAVYCDNGSSMKSSRNDVSVASWGVKRRELVGFSHRLMYSCCGILHCYGASNSSTEDHSEREREGGRGREER
ncbi:hypothetical protein SAY86_016435 [Trapa natans]|uniref:Uncharacterized protein n=1 Tax=Trapa natans TaxID=22666 RepID=A0AAN7LG15_TRANT|nr:hypothetical protein SAY86_016435 [Trapa natans]